MDYGRVLYFCQINVGLVHFYYDTKNSTGRPEGLSRVSIISIYSDPRQPVYPLLISYMNIFEVAN